MRPCSSFNQIVYISVLVMGSVCCLVVVFAVQRLSERLPQDLLAAQHWLAMHALQAAVTAQETGFREPDWTSRLLTSRRHDHHVATYKLLPLFIVCICHACLCGSFQELKALYPFKQRMWYAVLFHAVSWASVFSSTVEKCLWPSLQKFASQTNRIRLTKIP